MRDREAVYKERNAIIRQVCQEYGNVLKRPIDFQMKSFTLEEDHGKLAFCRNAKVAKDWQFF